MKHLVKVIFNINSEYQVEKPKEYIFAAFEEYKQGDVVVVDTRRGYHLATIVGFAKKLPDCVPNEALKDVVCKADFSKFIERKERRIEAQELKKQMDERIKNLQLTAMYERLAEKDPELKEMLNRFKELSD